MKSWNWVFGVTVLCVAVGVALLFVIDQSAFSEPTAASEVSQGVSTSGQGAAIDPATSGGIDDEQPLSLSEIVPELERLAAVIPEPKNLTAQSPEQLQQEAEQLVQQMDESISSLELWLSLPPSLSPAEVAEIEQQPEFKASLER